MRTILKCTDCPFNGQDNVYCRTCSIPIREALRNLSDVRKVVVGGKKQWQKCCKSDKFNIVLNNNP